MEEIPLDDWLDEERRIKSNRMLHPIDQPLPTSFDTWAPLDREPSEKSPEEMIRDLEEWEDQLETCERVPLRQFLGFPTVKPLSELSPRQIDAELDRLFTLMEQHRIFLDTLAEVESAELYRFIVEEFLNEEVANIPNSPMETHFCYEEYYPNDEYDVKTTAEDVLCWVLKGIQAPVDSELPPSLATFKAFPPPATPENKFEFLMFHFSDTEFYAPDETPIHRKQWLESLERFWQRHPCIENIEVKAISASIDGEYASVKLVTNWDSLHAGVQIRGISTVRLKRSDYGGWDVIQMKISGWRDLVKP